MIKLSKIYIGYYSIELNKTFKTALRQTDSVTDVIVIIESSDGLRGIGSAAEVPIITGDFFDSIVSSIKKYIWPNIVNIKIDSIGDVYKITNMIDKSLAANTGAKAAVDMAVFDLFARISNQPLHKAINPESRIVEVKSVSTISLDDEDIMLSSVNDVVRKGIDLLKIKLGSKQGVAYDTKLNNISSVYL